MHIRSTLIVCSSLIWGASVQAEMPYSSVPFLEALQAAESIAATNSNWSVYRAQGASMESFYGNHSLVLVQKTAIRDLRVGMLVLYRSPSGDCIAHRVAAHHGAWVRARGFSNLRDDPYFIRSDMIVGTVFMVLHTAGFSNDPAAAAAARSLVVAHCKPF